MINPKDIHVILIGNNEVYNFYANMEIIRDNYEFGNDIWISCIYNGDLNELCSGARENNFITLNENRGYQLGALDLYNKAFEVAKLVNRKYTLIMNFDVWILDQNNFLGIFEGIQKDKHIGIGRNIEYGHPLTDICVFKTSHIPKYIRQEILPERIENLHLTNMESFDILEEWFLCMMYENNLYNSWYILKRDNHPRYRWTHSNSIMHEHDIYVKKKRLMSNNIFEGNLIKQIRSL